MEVTYINDTVESTNWGAIAASSALRKMIKETGGGIEVTFHQSAIKNFRFTGKLGSDQFSENRSAGNVLDLITPPLIPKVYNKIKMVTGLRNEPEIPSDWEQFKQFAHDCMSKQNTLSGHFQRMEHTDVTVINGEGCIFGNKFLSKIIFLLGYISSSIMGKPTIMVNHTADYSDPILHRLAENVYPFFDDVVVRDYISLRDCEKYCSCSFAADSSYCYEPLPKEIFIENYYLSKERLDTSVIENVNVTELDPSIPYICVGGSSLLSQYRNEVYDGFKALIYELKKLPVQVVLTASAAPDYKLFKPLAREVELPLIGVDTPVSLAISILGHAKVYIGGRWHPGNMALSGGTPVVPLSANTFKMNALAELQGLSSKVFEIGDLQTHKFEIVELTKKYLDEGEALREKMLLLSDSFRENVNKNVKFLENLVVSEQIQ